MRSCMTVSLEISMDTIIKPSDDFECVVNASSEGAVFDFTAGAYYGTSLMRCTCPVDILESHDEIGRLVNQDQVAEAILPLLRGPRSA